MLPIGRYDDHLYSVPKFEVVVSDVEDFMNELKAFHGIFHDCFHRKESRTHFLNYMSGQFSSLERKSIEPIALAAEGGNVRGMQRFISQTQWDDDKIITRHRCCVKEDFGRPDAAVIFDESDFVKKGSESIGVARQYCGSIGKVENSQVGVFAAYVSENGYSIIDKELFIPEKWFGDEYQKRRKKCQLPEDIVFQTKPQLAAGILDRLVREDGLPFKYVLADSVCGAGPEFINAVDSLADKTYLVSVSKKTCCWPKKPLTATKPFRPGGKQDQKVILVNSDDKPMTVEKIARNTNDYFWYRRQVSEGTKGPVTYEFTRRRIVLSSVGLPQKTVWLLIRRTLGENPKYSYFISNASSNVRLKTLVWLSGLRWAIEQCFEESKDLGMDHYEVRKYNGWHHHMLTCMMAHYFLWHLKIRLGKKSAVYYSVAAQDSYRMRPADEFLYPDELP